VTAGAAPGAQPDPRLRVMTYNIRHGRGWSGRVELERIIDVIAAAEPDVVALQEVDVLRLRSGGVDQAERLAARLGMTPSFAPCISVGDEHYGIATLSRLPLLGSRQLHLPPEGSLARRRWEPRSALATRLDWDGRPVEVVNTHLSLRHRERVQQIDHILDDVAAMDDDVVVCGDLNCTTRSAPYRTLCGVLREVPAAGRSWPARLPVLRLDHLFYRGNLAVRDAAIIRSRAARMASDHLPLVASFTAGTRP
jgi:endonuclease/exonuclease/phosphatase family metal-dependent hydrolase